MTRPGRWTRALVAAGLLLATGCVTTRIDCGFSSPRDVRLHVPDATSRPDIELVARAPDGTETRVESESAGHFVVHVPGFRFCRYTTFWVFVDEQSDRLKPFVHVMLAGEEQRVLSAAELEGLPLEEDGCRRLDLGA